VRLLQDVRIDFLNEGILVATDNSITAPALYAADKQYIVPKITDADYRNIIMNICKKENIKAITTLIDPEIEFLAVNRDFFWENNILPLCPSYHSALLCFDKYLFYNHLQENNILTTKTYKNIDDFKTGLQKGEISFPIFIKPRTGSGSVGAHKIQNMEELELHFFQNEHNYIIQEFMNGEDIDADVYVDCISKKMAAVFTKKKLATKIGGASKTISFIDQNLFSFIEKIVDIFDFSGPLDMDFWYKDGKYYLSEINPRFGGAYIHAYASGVNFPKLILNNIKSQINTPNIGNYESDIVMMMYDDVVIKKKSELVNKL
jgi:carbamoyl-phosphate synthase large subunit